MRSQQNKTEDNLVHILWDIVHMFIMYDPSVSKNNNSPWGIEEHTNTLIFKYIFSSVSKIYFWDHLPVTVPAIFSIDALQFKTWQNTAEGKILLFRDLFYQFLSHICINNGLSLP